MEAQDIEIINKAFEETCYVLKNCKNAVVSVSGGKDSDVIIDLVCRSGYKDKCYFVTIDTGIEFKATIEHLEYLEKRYGIKIEIIKSSGMLKITEKYGQPFISKRVSGNIEALQSHGFKWENKPLDKLMKEYPNCKAPLRWWCNDYKINALNIRYTKLLKKFLMQNPPTFKISAKCGKIIKINNGKIIAEHFTSEVSILGLRKAEGGQRAMVYDKTINVIDGNIKFLPIFFFSDEIEKEYNKMYNIVNSRCYTEYGMNRTGCALCPIGHKQIDEVSVLIKYEPELYEKAMKCFGKSIDYTNKYLEFVKNYKPITYVVEKIEEIKDDESERAKNNV